MSVRSAAAQAQPAIATKGLSKDYGSGRGLFDLDLMIEEARCYASPFYYYAGHDPLSEGVDVADLAVLAAIAVAFTAIAVVTIQRRDLRG